MPYPPNGKHWQYGDIVVHAGDAKERKMLMRVVGYTHEGLCKTRYLFPHLVGKQWVGVMEFRLSKLLDPKKFNISLEGAKEGAVK